MPNEPLSLTKDVHFTSFCLLLHVMPNSEISVSYCMFIDNFKPKNVFHTTMLKVDNIHGRSNLYFCLNLFCLFIILFYSENGVNINEVVDCRQIPSVDLSLFT